MLRHDSMRCINMCLRCWVLHVMLLLTVILTFLGRVCLLIRSDCGSVILFQCCFSCLWYGDNAGSTVQPNSSTFLVICLCWLLSAVMGKSQARLVFKSQFEHFLGMIRQFKDSIRQPTIGIRFDLVLFAIRFGLLDSTAESLLVVTHQSFSVFSFFACWVKWFPSLKVLATKFLIVQATLSSVERLFSVSGCLMSARRYSVNATTVEALLLWLELLRECMAVTRTLKTRYRVAPTVTLTDS